MVCLEMIFKCKGRYSFKQCFTLVELKYTLPGLNGTEMMCLKRQIKYNFGADLDKWEGTDFF